MDSIKAIFKKSADAIGYFLKYKKHLYIKPLFFIIIALGIVLLSVYVYKNVIHEPEELITMDFSEADDEVSYDFSGTTVALDPGHGGEDPGAPSKYGENEDTIVYSIASMLEQSLTEAGAKVIMTRGADETVSLDDRKVEADLFISLHSDAFDDPAISGFTTFYTYPNQEAFGEHLNAALDEHSLLFNRGNQVMQYQVVWQLDYPGVLIELGYLSNEFDDYILNQEDYQDEMVTAIMEGIDSYLKR
ncbi:N-acetylmuramoyl-L-alanine amidase family protein [Jeotgalicoccus halotolerans]|uniref:N-acetylmuramoyl-L-alanine amidase n=1 Tax=Jeotgalicoccus halotolerans TaxID=157227 RepID=A0A3E0B1F7_9STAP|nr:N-acetylmuramoyl-L-alanine amidase [Jeotgalicoccus halotolerans]REG25785.1 N-acetylmuramoyl-L-alanine amidase [Jeotgalicoccus halotolerans]